MSCASARTTSSRIDADPVADVGEVRPLLAGQCESLFVGAVGGEVGLQPPGHIDLPVLDGEQEAQPLPCGADLILRPDHLGAGVFHRHLRRQDVVIGGHTGLELSSRLLQVPFLLFEVMERQGVELPGEEHVVKGGGDVASGRLLVDAELLVGGLEPDLRRPDRRAHLAPGEEGLGQADLGGPPFRPLASASGCRSSGSRPGPSPGKPGP